MREPEVLVPRDVPLGGVRAMNVRRTLPHRERRMVGAWCFLDDYGPTPAVTSPVMDVPPHPHTSLQTVTWLLDGEVHHRDSLGTSLVVRPGELNLMTAGRGISHSEVSVGGSVLRGVQLWVALPSASAAVAPHVDHHDDLPETDSAGARLVVILGSSGGVTSPAPAYSALVAVEVTLLAEQARVPLERRYEHGVVPLDGGLRADGVEVPVGGLRYLEPGGHEVGLAGRPGSRVLVLGGEPFDEQLVMWWNFVGRNHDEVAAARADWEADRLSVDPTSRFGVVEGYDGHALAAPPLPTVPLLPRPRHRAVGPTRGRG